MSQLKINLKIVTPERTVYEQEVDQVTLPVLDGQVTILPNHRSYIGALKSGEIMAKKDGEEFYMATSGGFIEFNSNTLTVLADTAEHAAEIDVERAQEARQRAEDLKKEKISMDEQEYARVAAAIEKEAARLRVARRHHGKSGITLN